MRESTKMLLHYITGFIILVTGAIHLLASNLSSFAWIKTTPQYPVGQAIFLAALLYHSLNGLRVILIELRPGLRTSKTITITLLALGILIYIFGLYSLDVIFDIW
ncbi:MAG: hypothetical protein ABDH32_05570 [Candidatus Caldarchaeales archaeon]